MSFTNVAHRGNFRWQYDGFYQDLDGSLNGLPGQILFPPDGLWNTTTLCTPTPNFLNGISCPTSLGTWLRFGFNHDSLSQPGEMLFVYDSSNHVAVEPRLQDELTHPKGYAMALLARRTYTFVFQYTNVKFLSYSSIGQFNVVFFLEFSQFVIHRCRVQFGSRRLFNSSSSNRNCARSSLYRF